jgi:hypothetical protein
MTDTDKPPQMPGFVQAVRACPFLAELVTVDDREAVTDYEPTH